MDSAAAALIGMGLAAAGFAGAGVGIGYIFGKMIEAVAGEPTPSEAELRTAYFDEETALQIRFFVVEEEDHGLAGALEPLCPVPQSRRGHR